MFGLEASTSHFTPVFGYNAFLFVSEMRSVQVGRALRVRRASTYGKLAGVHTISLVRMLTKSIDFSSDVADPHYIVSGLKDRTRQEIC